MSQYAGLTKAGCEAVKAVYPDAKIIIHLDGGCDPKRYNFIFDGLQQYDCPWDIIGISVYPYWDIEAKLESSWQGTIRDFTANIRALYKKYHTPLMVVETGVESNKPEEGKQILAEIIRASKEDCEGHCLGVFYWAPEAEGHYPLGAFQDLGLSKTTSLQSSWRPLQRPHNNKTEIICRFCWLFKGFTVILHLISYD